MTAWTEDLTKLVKPLSDRYEFRPRLEGVIIFCTTCGSLISEVTQTKLLDAVKEAEEHEKLNHSRRKS